MSTKSHLRHSKFITVQTHIVIPKTKQCIQPIGQNLLLGKYT